MNMGINKKNFFVLLITCIVIILFTRICDSIVDNMPMIRYALLSLIGLVCLLEYSVLRTRNS